MIWNAIENTEIQEVLTTIDRAEAEAVNGLDKVIRHLDEYFNPKTFARKLSLWNEFRLFEKTEKMSWSFYISKFKRLKTDLYY